MRDSSSALVSVMSWENNFKSCNITSLPNTIKEYETATTSTGKTIVYRGQNKYAVIDSMTSAQILYKCHAWISQKTYGKSFIHSSIMDLIKTWEPNTCSDVHLTLQVSIASHGMTQVLYGKAVRLVSYLQW